MKLVVFGGTGGTGALIVREALAAGHHVTVVARTPSKVTEKHENLRILAGDVTDAATLGPAVEGADAVISALGAASNKAPVTIHRVGIATSSA